MFGGLNAATGVRGDTWLWDGTAWSPAAPSSSPSGRSIPEMAYDPARRQTVVLFSGIGNPSLADTWEWDGSNWNQLSPPASPSIRGEGGIGLRYGTAAVSHVRRSRLRIAA